MSNNFDAPSVIFRWRSANDDLPSASYARARLYLCVCLQRCKDPSRLWGVFEELGEKEKEEK